MIHPSPTTKIRPGLFRGVLESFSPGSGREPGHVQISAPNTNYRLTLGLVGELKASVGARVVGIVRARVQRVDVCHTGGAFIEPVYGRPRRLQGRVLGAGRNERTLVIDGPVPMHCELMDARQRAGDFPAGVMVTCGVQDGATFEMSDEFSDVRG